MPADAAAAHVLELLRVASRELPEAWERPASWELETCAAALANALADDSAGPRWLDRGTRRSVLRIGSLVVKCHGSDSPGRAPTARPDPPPGDAQDLTRRLEVAATVPAFLSPLRTGPLTDPAGRHAPLSLWPWAPAPHWPDPDCVPWSELGLQLARLHLTTSAGLTPLPAAATVRRAERVRAELFGALHPTRSDPDGSRLGRQHASDVAALLQVLDDAVVDLRSSPGPGLLVHGDWHLGQLVQDDGRLRLIDIDDLGIGHPAWDLGRTAAGFAAGLIDEPHWAAFIDGYRSQDGPALRGADPWHVVDAAARAALGVMTARLVLTDSTPTAADSAPTAADSATAGGASDDVEPGRTELCQSLLTTCRRVARWRHVE